MNSAWLGGSRRQLKKNTEKRKKTINQIMVTSNFALIMVLLRYILF